ISKESEEGKTEYAEFAAVTKREYAEELSDEEAVSMKVSTEEKQQILSEEYWSASGAIEQDRDAISYVEMQAPEDKAVSEADIIFEVGKRDVTAAVADHEKQIIGGVSVDETELEQPVEIHEELRKDDELSELKPEPMPCEHAVFEKEFTVQAGLYDETYKFSISKESEEDKTEDAEFAAFKKREYAEELSDEEAIRMELSTDEKQQVLSEECRGVSDATVEDRAIFSHVGVPAIEDIAVSEADFGFEVDLRSFNRAVDFSGSMFENHSETAVIFQPREGDARISALNSRYAESFHSESVEGKGQEIESFKLTTVVSQYCIKEKIVDDLMECARIEENAHDINDFISGQEGKTVIATESYLDSTFENSLVFSEAEQETVSSEMDENTKIALVNGTKALLGNADDVFENVVHEFADEENETCSGINIIGRTNFLDSSFPSYTHSSSHFIEKRESVGNDPFHISDGSGMHGELNFEEVSTVSVLEKNKPRAYLVKESISVDSNEHEFYAQIAKVVDDIVRKIENSLSCSESNYKTATAVSKDSYETCLTSQEDIFESAQGCYSQESEYTTAASEVSSRLSGISENRRGSETPVILLSPIQHDCHYIVSNDEKQKLDKTVDSKLSSPSMPDIEFVLAEDENDTEKKDVSGTSTDGILLSPNIDIERPMSPIPPSLNNGENSFMIPVTSENLNKSVGHSRQMEIRILDSIVEAPVDDILVEDSYSSCKQDVSGAPVFQEMLPGKVIHLEKERSAQYYSESEIDTTSDSFVKEEAMRDVLSTDRVVHIEGSDSSDSLDKKSVQSSSSSSCCKQLSISRQSSSSSRKSLYDEPQVFVERLTPELKMIWAEKNVDEGSTKQFLFSPSEDFPTFVPENEQMNSVEIELGTVDEEPEEADSLNGRSTSSNGQGTDINVIVGKFKTVSSDNVSETSLQEFERIERDVLNKGESSLSGSELELYVVGKLKTANGSTSSLAEFERLEQEVTVEGSPQDEVMILSDIREESEVEEMSIRDDDEEEHDSISDIKAIPVEDDTQMPTPMASPTDSIERDFDKIMHVMETSADSLELSPPVIVTGKYLVDESLSEYEVIERIREGIYDSLETIPQNKDSVEEEGTTMQELTCFDRQALTDDAQNVYQVCQEDKDSLTDETDTVFTDYSTTLTTFETTQINEDGSTEVISRRVLTRVTDPVMSHVQFTGTENEHRLRDLEREQEFETVDIEGNVTRTTLHRSAPSSAVPLPDMCNTSIL
ncbi:unnamed protein product, partial [Thelazia callipaeda]|uniref:Cardiomyopathy-associated protein 5 n=1 Tax=Thelazia callipaeda TaxID=103827 RepID=A0A0N5CR35_THECL